MVIITNKSSANACARLAKRRHLSQSDFNTLSSSCGILCNETPRHSSTSDGRSEPAANLPLVDKSLRMLYVNQTEPGRKPKTMDILERCESYYQHGEGPNCRCIVYSHKSVSVKYHMTCQDGKARWLKTSKKMRSSCSCYQEDKCLVGAKWTQAAAGGINISSQVLNWSLSSITSRPYDYEHVAVLATQNRL